MSFNTEKGTSKSTSSGTSNQTATPNNLPFLQSGWNAASSLIDGSNPTLANGLDLSTTGANNTSAAANGGLTTATNFANGGATNTANGYLTPTADGSMLMAGNPYFANMVKQMSDALQPQVDGAFGSAGRYGSGADANAFNTALTNETGQLANSNYQTGLTNQLNASDQLSTNSTNSTNSALAALGLIPGLGTASTGAGSSLTAAGIAPSAAYASILSLLGSGGGTVNGTATGQQQGSTTSTGLTVAPKFSFGPLSFGG